MKQPVDRDLVGEVRATLKARADPARAEGAQAYMKSAMPSLGVKVPEVRRIVRELAKELPYSSVERLRDDVLRLWRSAEYREELYAAIDLTSLRLAADDLDMLPVYEEIIRTGAWWDLVDGVSDRLCRLLQVHRDAMTPVLLEWSRDQDFWIRRASITSQLRAKLATDTELLSAVVLANTSDKEFFIRKAIGWALREYSSSNPDWVRRFAAEHAGSLSPLSLKEARRKLPPEGQA